MARRAVLFGTLWTAVLAACAAPGSSGPAASGPAASGPSGSESFGAGSVTTSKSGLRRQVYEYGQAAAQVAELLLPAGTPRGVVVLVHGGFWQAGYDRTLEDKVAADLIKARWAVWNLDYRAVGDGGGWPATFTDVAAGTDHLAVAAGEHALSLDTVVAVGHSAGGALALWLAARPQLPTGALGAAPVVRLTAVASQAGVNNLATGSRDRLGEAAVDSVVGGSPAQVPERYAVVDPSQLLPLGIPVLVVSGADDDIVPATQAREFAAAAEKAGDDVWLEVVPSEGHFEHLEPDSGVWRAVRTWLDGLA